MENVKTASWVYNDGGRSNYFTGKGVGDCVARAIAIASGIDYKEVYDTLAEGQSTQRVTKRAKRYATYNHTSARFTRKDGKVKHAKSAQHGIHVKRKWFKDQMREWGFRWVATMQIGSGCQTHLRADELPKGRLVVAVSKHYTCVINGVVNDTYDCSRNGTRCVYGYWIYEG